MQTETTYTYGRKNWSRICTKCKLSEPLEEQSNDHVHAPVNRLEAEEALAKHQAVHVVRGGRSHRKLERWAEGPANLNVRWGVFQGLLVTAGVEEVDGVETCEISQRDLGVRIRIVIFHRSVLEHHVGPAVIPAGDPVVHLEHLVRVLVGVVDAHVVPAQVGIIEDMQGLFLVVRAPSSLKHHEDVDWQFLTAVCRHAPRGIELSAGELTPVDAALLEVELVLVAGDQLAFQHGLDLERWLNGGGPSW